MRPFPTPQEVFNNFWQLITPAYLIIWEEKSQYLVKPVSDRELSQEQLQAELASLRQEVTELRKTKTVFDAQNELLNASMKIIQASSGSVMIKTVLQQALTIASKLTTTEEGSLFLLDRHGVVKESILARGAVIRQQKQTIIGKVLDKGLAGWVIRHRRVGLVADTTEDERWLTLSDQPYVVRSVLCVPILRGKTLLGIITLMHSQPHHFQASSVQLAQMIAAQMVLLLDIARMQIETQSSQPHSTSPPKSKEEASLELGNLGMYIIVAKGKFLYANRQLAEIFGYTFEELLSLESVFSLVATDELNSVKEEIKRCLEKKKGYLSLKVQGRCKDAKKIEAEFSGHRTKFYGKSVIIGVVRAI